MNLWAAKYFSKTNAFKGGGGIHALKLRGITMFSHISANILTNTAKKILDVSGAD